MQFQFHNPAICDKIQAGDNDKFIVKKKNHAFHEPILRGRDINKYYYSFSNNFVLFDPKKLWSNTNEKMFRVKEKIINRQTGSQLIGAYDNKGYFSLDSTHVQILVDQSYSLKFILALFNSKLLNYYYNNRVNESGRVFAQIKIVILKTLPIKMTTAFEQIPFIDLVDRILAAKRANPQADTSTLEREIDQLVYQSYGLAEEEIGIVEGKRPPPGLPQIPKAWNLGEGKERWFDNRPSCPKCNCSSPIFGF
jgi:hypothetical protein